VVTDLQLHEMSQLGMEETDRASLVDITAIEVDPSQSAEQRMESLLERINNPYLFLCGDTAVRIRFDPEGKDLSHKLKNYFISLKSR
jgi:hypothetical protein